MRKPEDDLPRTSAQVEDTIARAVARLGQSTRRLLESGLLAGALLSGALPLSGCDPTGADDTALPIPTTFPGAGDKGDWAEYEGTRDTRMVAYLGGAWHEYRECNSRGGCQIVDVFIKVRVRPVQGASIDRKRVGVVYRAVGVGGAEQTALGQYFTTLPSGDEEWHVPIRQRAWESSVLVFDAWYQDGTGRTYYDDNDGELHALAYQGNWAVIRLDYANTALEIDDAGVKGTIGVYLADLDFDKDVRLVFTLDDWKTTQEVGIGEGPNHTHWIEDVWQGHERWGIDVDLPAANVQRFQYALVYRHGVVGGATRYEFWENNGGGNHVVTRPVIE